MFSSGFSFRCSCFAFIIHHIREVEARIKVPSHGGVFDGFGTGIGEMGPGVMNNGGCFFFLDQTEGALRGGGWMDGTLMPRVQAACKLAITYRVPQLGVSICV